MAIRGTSGGGTAGICDRTDEVQAAILGKISGVTDCADVTDAQIAAITGDLDLRSEDITALAAGDFAGLTALTRLLLSENSLTELPAGVFDELTSLKELWLHDNSLITLPDGVFDGLPVLETLYLYDNEDLTTLPAGVFDELTSLTELWLNGNGLTELPDGVFDELTKLETLYLDGNSLATLPAGVFDKLTALTALQLQGNPGAPFSPTADALPDNGTVPPAGGTVTLDGSGSEGGPWGTNVTYSWSQTSGPTSGVTFDDDASATPVVTIPALTAGTELIFTLTVTGRGGANTSYGTATATDTATATATASSLPTLVSNTDQTLESVGSIHFHAQSFETGATTGGYTVSEVDVHLAIVSGSRSTSVSIRENDGSDEPGDLVATLTNPGTLTPDSLNTFTASDVITLEPSTTYWISVNEGITSVSNRATFGRVGGDDETGEPGWSIGDGRLWRDAETKSWTSSDKSLMIAIRGTALCDGIWCATLTVRDLGSDDRGCGNISSGNECTTYLSEDEFTHAMTDYSVTGVRVKSNGQLQMFLDADIATDSESLVLHVGSDTFAFEDANVKVARNRKWNSSGLTWTTADTIQLKLTEGGTNSDDATLSSLNLSNVTLAPTFVSGTHSYTASVANSVTSTTVTAETTNTNATSVIKLDGTEDADGTVDLALGANTITVEVTAEDTTTTLTYTIAVTRATDTASLVLSRTSMGVGEAGSDDFTVKLATLPSGQVTVTVTSDDTGAATVSPASLTFTTTDWNSTQTVTVSGVEDSDTDNEDVTVTASASGGGYAGEMATVRVTVTDNNTAQTVPGAPRNLRATASGQTQIDLAWNAPSSDGNSAITGYRIEVSTNSGSSWSDLVADTGSSSRTYSHMGLSAGTTRHYRVSAINAVGTGNPSGVANATTGVTAVTFGASSYTATEGGSSATVVVRLSPAPATTVTIPLTTMRLGGATVGDYSVIPDDVMFTSGQMQRTFTVTAVDDSDVDGDDERVRIGFGTLPSGYAPGSPAMTTVALVDDEGARRVVVGFTTHTAYVGERRESESRFKVPVRLDRAPLRSVTIPLVVTHLGGATAADYSGIPASVTFGPNDTKADFFMRVIPDEQREIGEGLRIDFGDLPSSVSKDWWGRYETIEFVDDLLDSTVWFGTDAYTATEGGGGALVSIHLDAPVKLEPLEVGLVLQYGGGATAADHGTIPEVVRFAIGERTKTITVAATNDSDDDDGESVTLSFVNVSGDRVNISHQPTKANTTMVSLADNDGLKPVTVSFGAATYTAREGGSSASVSVELDATPGRSVTVPLTTTHRGGATGADYSGVPASVTFGANVTRKTFTVTATDDSADDNGESLSIGFGTLPAGVSAGSPAVVALDDDDSSVRWVTVGFDTAEHIAFQVRESTWPSRITLSLNRVAQRTLTIPLVVTHVGGATEADYTGIPASVTFGPDQRRVGFRVYGTLDEEIESGEGLRIGFGPLPLPPGVRVESSRSYETVEFVDTSNNPATGTPRISGTPQVGEKLKADTADIADDDGLTKVTYSYQWVANDGSTDTDIQNATDSRYTPVADDVGKTIRVKVSFTDDAGHEATLTSGATDAVAVPVPDKPTGLSAAVSHDAVTLTWDDPQDDAITGYVILRRDRAIHPTGTFVTIAGDTGSAQTTYTDETVEPDQEYVYRIQAINEHGKVSERSDWVRGFTPAAPAPAG